VKLKTRVIADASPVALGAVLIQFDVENNPFIISFASNSLSEKESLALVWSVEKFHYYVAGLEFELVTDHKPLEAIFKPTSKPPARIERWLLRLQAYRFQVIYKSGKDGGVHGWLSATRHPQFGMRPFRDRAGADVGASVQLIRVFFGSSRLFWFWFCFFITSFDSMINPKSFGEGEKSRVRR